MTMMMLPTDGPGGDGDGQQAPREARVRAWGRRQEDAETLRRHAEIAAAFRAILRDRVEQICNQP
jgi:hypothetical protein